MNLAGQLQVGRHLNCGKKKTGVKKGRLPVQNLNKKNFSRARYKTERDQIGTP